MHLEDTHRPTFIGRALTVEEELIAMCREIERLYRQNSDLQDENETLRQHLHTQSQQEKR